MDQGRNAFDGSFYAGLTFNNLPDGRTVQMAWQPGNHGATWTGNASFPAQLRLVTTPAGLRVTRNPVAELAGLRADTTDLVEPHRHRRPGHRPVRRDHRRHVRDHRRVRHRHRHRAQFGFQLHRRADGGYTGP